MSIKNIYAKCQLIVCDIINTIYVLNALASLLLAHQYTCFFYSPD